MFEFGSIISLNYKVTFYCFLAVVFFVIIFEYLTEIIEYFLNESLYSQMIQIIYKELMLMGLVTFCVILFEADPRSHSPSNTVYVIGIDFSHVFLFFVTLFFVMHGFYLIVISMITTKEYHKNLTEKTFELIVKLEKVQRSAVKSLLYRLHIYPISSIRHRVEFSLIHSIFTRTYLLPMDFDFPQYLSSCFDRFALKTISRSIFSWLMLLLVIGANCVRIGWGVTCNYNAPAGSTTTTHRMLLTQQQRLSSLFTESALSLSSSETPNNTIAVQQQHQGHLLRALFTISDANAKHTTDPNVCRTEDFKLFILCGILLVTYTICINVVALIYKSRYL